MRSRHFVEIRTSQQVTFPLPFAMKKGFLNSKPKAATPKAATPKADMQGYLAQGQVILNTHAGPWRSDQKRYSTRYVNFESLPLDCIIEMLKHADGERFNKERTDIMNRYEADCCLIVGFGIYNSTPLMFYDQDKQLEAMASEYQRRKCPLRDMSIQNICNEV